jgi:hypothetical protein
LSNIESGQRKVDALELKILADLYRQSIGYFTGDVDAATTLPADVAHLARTASELSAEDRQELGRFAEYLRARSTAGKKP